MYYVELWKPHPEIPNELLVSDGYTWDENGLVIILSDISNTIRITLTFNADVRSFKVSKMTIPLDDMGKEWYAEIGKGYALPFFIRRKSEYLDWVISQTKDFDNVDYSKLVHYIICTHDFCYEIVDEKNVTCGLKRIKSGTI